MVIYDTKSLIRTLAVLSTVCLLCACSSPKYDEEAFNNADYSVAAAYASSGGASPYYSRRLFSSGGF